MRSKHQVENANVQVLIVGVFVVLFLFFVKPANSLESSTVGKQVLNAENLPTPSIDAAKPLLSEAVNFPTAPKNTPYSMVAKLGSAQPTAKFVYSNQHPDQYVAYWMAHPADSRGVVGEVVSLVNNSFDSTNIGTKTGTNTGTGTNTDSSAKGVVVFIHGGCWLSAYDISHTYAFATALSQSGYHVWSIEYRRAGNGGEWPVALDDVKLGLQKMEILKQSGVDLERVSIVGHSAGGHLAAMLGVQLDDVLPKAVKKADIIGLAAIIDIVEYANGTVHKNSNGAIDGASNGTTNGKTRVINSCQSATPSFMHGMPSEQPAAYYLANPRNFDVTGRSLGVFQLLQGDADTIVPYSQASHKNAKTVKLDGVGHFDWIHPGSDAFKHLLIQLEANNTKAQANQHKYK